MIETFDKLPPRLSLYFQASLEDRAVEIRHNYRTVWTDDLLDLSDSTDKAPNFPVTQSVLKEDSCSKPVNFPQLVALKIKRFMQKNIIQQK